MAIVSCNSLTSPPGCSLTQLQELVSTGTAQGVGPVTPALRITFRAVSPALNCCWPRLLHQESLLWFISRSVSLITSNRQVMVPEIASACYTMKTCLWFKRESFKRTPSYYEQRSPVNKRNPPRALTIKMHIYSLHCSSWFAITCDGGEKRTASNKNRSFGLEGLPVHFLCCYFLWVVRAPFCCKRNNDHYSPLQGKVLSSTSGVEIPPNINHTHSRMFL